MRFHQSIYRALFVIFLLVQLVLPDIQLVVPLAFMISLVLLIEKRVKMNKALLNILVALSILLVFGIFVGVFNAPEWYDLVRDILHFSRPIFVILCGFLLMRKINDPGFFIRTIVYVSLLFAMKHFILIGITNFERGTIEELRLKAGGSSFIEIIAFISLMVFNREKVLKMSVELKYICLFIVGASILLYVSRTMLTGLFFLILSCYGYTILSRKAFEYSTFAFILLGVLYASLYAVELNPDAKGIENFFYKIRNAPAEVFTTPDNYDPNNHKEIFDHWRGYEAKMAFEVMDETPLSYASGKGLGSLVDLKFKAPVGGEDGLRYIPHLHNGYVYIYFKTGVIGVLLYLFVLVNLYKRGYVETKTLEAKYLNRLISGLGIYFFFTTFVITGMYNLGEVSVFILGGLYAASIKYEKLAQKVSNKVSI